jgi:dynein heavy chain, axonemal
MEFYKGQNANF